MIDNQTQIPDDQTALKIKIGQREDGTFVRIKEDISIRTLEKAEKKYNAPAFTLTEATNVREWAEWGHLDNLPNFIYARLASVPMSLQAMQIMAKDMYGNGLFYVKKKDFFEGRLLRTYDPDIEKFISKNRLRTHFLPNAILNRLLFWNAFAQIDFTKDRKVHRIFHLDSMWTRLTKQNQKNNEIEYAKFCAKFGAQGEIPTDRDIITMPLFKWYKDDFFDWLRGDSMVMHTKGMSVGTTYYARPLWLSLLNEDHWLDTVADIPKIIRSMAKNQIRPMYMMRVSLDYFKFRYPEWQSYDDEKRNKIFDDFETKIEKSLVGIDNIGKLITLYHVEEGGKLLGMATIEAIEDKFKHDSWIPSSSAGNTEILNALGFHASQMSLINDGGSLGAGSGSDARVHFNAGVLRNTIEQVEILEPIQFAFDQNDWDYVALFDNFAQTTTDQNATGVAPSTSKQEPPKPQTAKSK